MNRDRVEGASKQIKGKIQQAWGRLNNDRSLVLRGRATEISGSAQAGLGRGMAAARGLLGYRRRVGV